MRLEIILLVVFSACFTARPHINGLNKSIGRIVGGRDATIEEHPYQVSFEFNKEHVCGGSLLTPFVVVTAAHCTYPLGFYILLGLTSVRAGTSTLGSGGLSIVVFNFTVHPKFINNEPDYDISLLFLPSPHTLGPTIQTIPIQSANQGISVGAIGTVTGWGALYDGGPLSSNLQAVEVPHVADDFCHEANIHLFPTTDRMTCFGTDEGGKGSCLYDNGGPLVVDGKLVGIIVVGWGDRCSLPGQPGIYTEVADPEINAYIVSGMESCC